MPFGSPALRRWKSLQECVQVRAVVFPITCAFHTPKSNTPLDGFILPLQRSDFHPIPGISNIGAGISAAQPHRNFSQQHIFIIVTLKYYKAVLANI